MHNCFMSADIIIHGEDSLERTSSYLKAYEVVLAYNLQPPLRREQGYWWLETLAEDPTQARDMAREWVRSQEDKMWECTDWVRGAGPHPPSREFKGETLPLYWSSPVEEGSPNGVAIRDPGSGRRLGFFFPGEEGFGLLRKRQAESSQAVGWVPMVHVIMPRHSSHHPEKRHSGLPGESGAPLLLEN